MSRRKGPRTGGSGQPNRIKNQSVVEGDNSGINLAGDRNKVTQRNDAEHVTKADVEQVSAMLAVLRTVVEEQAPPDKKGDALSRINELSDAVSGKDPEPKSTLAHVKKWFGMHIPALAGAVGDFVAKPVVTQVVDAIAAAAAKGTTSWLSGL